MNAQEVPNLEEMDEREATRLLRELASDLSAEKEFAIRHAEDYVMEMPQSGERFRGRENMRVFQEAFPANSNPPSIRISRVVVRDGLWVVQSVIDYGGGRVSHGAAILELKDGRVWRDTRYFADPFEAPEWRAHLVERMEPGEPDTALAQDEPIAAAENDPDESELRKLVERSWEKVLAGDFVGAHEWYDDAVVVEWPQSGERIRGKESLLALRKSYPAGVRFTMRRMIVRQGLCVSEYIIRYDGNPVYVVAIVEFAGTKVVRETHYFADPFPPPEWRAQWVELMVTG
jgi:hypothetical protein